jgi:hypothetical protein
MVYTQKDINHLELMHSLAGKSKMLKCEKCGETAKDTSTEMNCPDCCDPKEKDLHGGNGGKAKHCRECCETGHRTKAEAHKSYEENILKLCLKLQEKGFDKYATELERKFITYKQATTLHLYKVHKEDGDDLLDFAHPDGDAHIADAENGNGDVETKQNRHKKIVEIVNKAPTGKLATKSIVDAVKIALGQSVSKPSSDPLIQRYTGRILTYFKAVDNKIKEEGDISWFYKPAYNKITQDLYSMLNSAPMTLDTAKKIKETLMLFISIIRPKELEALPGYRNLGIISNQCWEDINNMDIDFSPLTSGLINALQIQSKQTNEPNKTERLKEKLEDLKIEVSKIHNQEHAQKANQLIKQMLDAINKLNTSDPNYNNTVNSAEEKVNELTKLIFKELGAK